MNVLLPLTITLLLSTLSLITACNITSVLENSSCKTFSLLITQTGAIKSYLTAQNGQGLTLFAPSDDAFKEQGSPDLSKLTNVELVSLLHYHALPNYIPIATLKTMTKKNIDTLATNALGKFDISVEFDSGGNLTVETGFDHGKIVSTAVDEAPVCIFVLDRVLQPVEIYGNATSPPPGPAMAPSGPEAVSPAPKKNGANKGEGLGVMRTLVSLSFCVFVMVFMF